MRVRGGLWAWPGCPIDVRCVLCTDRGHLRCALVAKGREGMQLRHMKQSPHYHGEAIGCTVCGVRNPRSRREPVRSSSDECVARPALRGLKLLALSPHFSYRDQAVHDSLYSLSIPTLGHANRRPTHDDGTTRGPKGGGDSDQRYTPRVRSAECSTLLEQWTWPPQGPPIS